jgi:hypothetical protein
MALAPWGVLARGKFRTDEEEERRNRSGEKGRMSFNAEWKRNEQEKAVSVALEKVAKEVGAKHVTAVAIAYVMQKTPYVFPIIGGRKVEHLQANLGALEIVLSPEHIKYLEGIVPFDLGFPTAMIVRPSCLLPRSPFLTFLLSRVQGDGSDHSYLMKNAAYMDKQPGLRAIVPDLS